MAAGSRTMAALSVLAAPDPVSPELVLVSPPEAARIARLLLPEQPQPAVPEPHAEPAGPRPIELAVAYLVCLVATVGPMAAFLLLR
jgi:hypothetical protein